VTRGLLAWLQLPYRILLPLPALLFAPLSAFSQPSAPAPQSSTNATLPSSPHLYNRYVALEMKSFTQVYRFGHDLVIPTLLNKSAEKPFIIDTGPFGNAISPDAAREVSKYSEDVDTTNVSNDVGTEISGFLGFSTLAMTEIKIDYRGGLVNFKFDSNRYCHLDCR
jgi:hypothetical protein